MQSIPKTMKAVHVDSTDGALSVQEYPVPLPGPGEVLVRIAAAPMNPSDLGFIIGLYNTPKEFPAIPGFEGSGTVVAVGSGLLPRLLKGKRVACASTRIHGGTWAEYMLTSATLCFPLAKGISFEQGSMVMINPMTALAFFDMIREQKHAAVVNTAAGSALGKMIIRLGQTRGIPVINVVRREQQVDHLRSLGATHVLNSSDPDFPERLRTLAFQLNATLFLDAVGGREAERLLEVAPRGTTLLLYANLSRENLSINPAMLLFQDKRIDSFYLADWARKKGIIRVALDLRKVQRMLGTELRSAVRKRLPLSSAQEGLNFYVNAMSAGKVLLIPNTDEILPDSSG